jgi:asparagine synthase (glutamine-hydrolysing)
MCGIAGVVYLSNTKVSINGLTNAISHRGPDGNGVFIADNIALGHRRLSIVDLSENGSQPMYSDDSRYVLVYNGEIYNHEELRKTLSKSHFNSSSDTETLLYGLIEFGTDFIKNLNGIFAFAFFDTFTNKLILVRDHFGTKPLYYYQDDDVLLFGSEIKSLITYENLDKTINQEALFNYIHLLWSPFERTPFEKVKKLRAGYFISLSVENPKDTWQETKYYDIPFDGHYDSLSEEDCIIILENKLLKAVERQLMSDVPVAFFLSGGIDSSLVVAMAKKLNPTQKIRCYTINTGNKETSNDGFSDDLHYARRVAKIFECELVEVNADVNIMEDFDEMIYHLDEPQGDIAPLSVKNICKQAQNDGYKVLLGGSAGDDVFSGYRRHQAIRLNKYFRFIPTFVVRGLKKILSKLEVSNPTLRRLVKFLSEADKQAIEQNFSYFRWLSYERTKNLFKNKSFSYDPLLDFKELLGNIPNETNELNQMLYWELKTFLPDHNLNYTDKMSMAVGVEVRVPFLDTELVEFSTKIPPQLKMKGVNTKYLLKKISEKYLPKDIIYRPKAGFGGPLRQWINTDLKSKIEDYLSEETIKKRGIFDYIEIQKLIEDNRLNKIDASYSILSLLAIESWYRQFVDAK